MNSSVPRQAGPIFWNCPALRKWEEELTYRITYIDTSSSPTREQRVAETARTEDYTSEQAALARARELLEHLDCHRVLVSDGVREPIGGVSLQLKVGFTSE
jgi:hypothetical protein